MHLPFPLLLSFGFSFLLVEAQGSQGFKEFSRGLYTALIPLGTYASYVITPRQSVSHIVTVTISTTFWSTSLNNKSLLSTITGTLVNLNPQLIGSAGTVEYTGKALLTGTCTTPYFVTFSSPALGVVEYAQIGCSEGYEGCCPEIFHLDAVYTRCPVGYTTAQARNTSGCCPSGYKIYDFAFDGQYPCFTIPATTYVPATTPTESDLTVVTDKIFARQFLLAATTSRVPTPVPTPSHLPAAKTTGTSRPVKIAVSVVLTLFCAGVLGCCCWWRRWRTTRSIREKTNMQNVSVRSFRVLGNRERTEPAVETGPLNEQPAAYELLAEYNVSQASSSEPVLPPSRWEQVYEMSDYGDHAHNIPVQKPTTC